MEPHLHDHDQVLLDKLTYRFRDPKRYEIIVFPGPEGGDQFFVKRVIALPGETVKITKGKVYVNDKEVKDYSKDHTTDSCELKGKFHLSSDEYFVLGDNRDNSNDSRRVLAESSKKATAKLDSSRNIKGEIVMNRYDEYMKEVQEKKKENQAIVNKIVEILKGNNLTVEHIEVILNMTREEVIKTAHL